MNEWINIQDTQKPEENQIVLVYNETAILIAQYIKIVMTYGGDFVSYGFFKWCDNPTYEHVYRFEYKKVTHWMPLPIPPR